MRAIGGAGYRLRPDVAAILRLILPSMAVIPRMRKRLLDLGRQRQQRPANSTLKTRSGLVKTSAMVMFIIANGILFTFVLASERIPGQISTTITEWDLQPWQFLILVNILLLFVCDGDRLVGAVHMHDVLRAGVA